MCRAGINMCLAFNQPRHPHRPAWRIARRYLLGAWSNAYSTRPASRPGPASMRPRFVGRASITPTATAITLTAMTKSRMLHPPFKHPVVGTEHQKLKKWGDQATRKRWDQRLTAFHGAQRRYMMLPVENTPDIATLPQWISQASVLQSCVA